MDWADIPWTNVVMVIALAIGLPLALRARKKGGPQKAETLLQHLQAMGIDASPVTGEIAESKIGIGKGSAQRCEGTFRIDAKNIDYINVVSIAGQYGVNYFIDRDLALEVVRVREEAPFENKTELKERVMDFHEDLFNQISPLIDVKSSRFSARVLGETERASSRASGVFERAGDGQVRLVYYRGF